MYNKISKPLSVLFAAWLWTGCASQIEKATLVFDYGDFGPQAMAYPALGPKKLPWQPQVPLMIGQGRIYVVVYRDIALAEVKQHYQANPNQLIDYRFIHYSDAIEYLDSRIAQNLLVGITERLKNTRHSIIGQLQ